MAILKHVTRELIFHSIAIATHRVLVDSFLKCFWIDYLQNPARLLNFEDLIVIAHILFVKIVHIHWRGTGCRGYSLIVSGEIKRVWRVIP